MEEQLNGKSELANLSVRDVFFKYSRFIPLFILSVIMAMVVGYVYLRYTTPIYNATGSIFLKNDAKSSGASNDKLEDLFTSSGTGNLPSEIEVLKSRPLMERVVKALNLNIGYYAVGKIREPNIYKSGPFLLEAFKIEDSAQGFSLNIKFPDTSSFYINDDLETRLTYGQLFRNTHGTFRLLKNKGIPGKEYIVTWQPPYNVAGGLAGSLAVAPKTQGTGILLVSIQTPNPDLSADAVNRLMQEYQLTNIEDKNITARQTLGFIDVRLDKLQKELDSIERAIVIFRQQNDIVDEALQSSLYFNRSSEADKEINRQRNQISVNQMIEGYLGDARNEFERIPSSLGLEDPTLNSLIAAYNQRQIEHKALLDGNAPRENVVVKQREQEIEKLRTSLLENLRNIRSAYATSLNKLLSQNSSLESRIKLLPQKKRELLEIDRQHEAKSALFKFLMAEREETAISQAATISNSKILDKAVPNTTPVKPAPKMVYLMAFLIGLALPGIFIFFLEILNDKVNTRYDIEKITQAPILGEIGHSYADEMLVVSKTNRTMVAEQFRSVRSNLQYVLNKAERPVILVSSSFSGEGKSFVSVNIGAVMALAGKKTVVLEFDIRKPKILSGLKLPKRAGITNFLVGKASLDELPVKVPDHQNLYVISCGPVPPNPSELLLDVRMNDLFIYLRQNFESIIIDTAPVGMVSDAMTLGKFADSTLYIVRQGHTFKKQIALIDEFYQQSRLPKISIILNDVKLKTGYGYYGYGRYGYGKGYGSDYYIEEEKPQAWYAKLLNGTGKRKMEKNS